MNLVKKRLQGRLEELYFNTLKSLFERIEPDGFFAESLTGTYCGEFPRTVGALVPLCLELGRFEAAERLLALAIEVMRRGGQGYAPHVLRRICWRPGRGWRWPAGGPVLKNTPGRRWRD